MIFNIDFLIMYQFLHPAFSLLLYCISWFSQSCFGASFGRIFYLPFADAVEIKKLFRRLLGRTRLNSIMMLRLLKISWLLILADCLTEVTNRSSQMLDSEKGI